MPQQALTWRAVGPRRRGAAPGRPTETKLEGKGGRLVTAGTALSSLSSLPYRPCALPGSRLTGWQPGAQQRPEEEPGLHAG